MSLKFLDLTRKTIGFRLTLWYSAVFVLSSLLFFGLAYFFLSVSIQQKDREVIQSELEGYIAQYNEGGTNALQQEVDLQKDLSGKNPFLVRLAGPENETVFLNIPDKWAEFDLRKLEKRDYRNKGHWLYLKTKNNQDILEVALQRLSDGSVLQVGKSVANRTELLDRFNKIFAGAILLVVFIGLTGGILFAVKTLRPIRHLLSTINSIIHTSNISARVPTRHTGDELDEMSIAFNTMLERIETLITELKMGLDNVAHDLRTPMMRLRGTAELALQSEQTEEVLREALSDCIEEADRITAMLNTLMDITEAETGVMKLNLQEVNIVTLIEEAVDLYGYDAEEKRIKIHTTLPEELYLNADGIRLRQVLSNLLDNAVKYTQSGGTIGIEAFQKKQQATVIVRDTGIGIPAEEVSKIWDRLYRGDKSRSQRGLGLGLSLVKAIVKAHQGYIEVSSEPGSGSLFSIHLPLLTAPHPS